MPHRIAPRVGLSLTALLTASLLQGVGAPARAETLDAPPTTASAPTPVSTNTDASLAAADSGAVVLAVRPWLCEFFPRLPLCQGK